MRPKKQHAVQDHKRKRKNDDAENISDSCREICKKRNERRACMRRRRTWKGERKRKA